MKKKYYYLRAGKVSKRAVPWERIPKSAEQALDADEADKDPPPWFVVDEDPEPPTTNQLQLLRHFNYDQGVTSKSAASLRIETLFEDPAKETEWNRQRRKQPATEAQMRRLNYAAKERNLKLPRNLDKQSASELIEQIYQSDLDLEIDYRETKRRTEKPGIGAQFQQAIAQLFAAVFIAIIIIVLLFQFFG